MCAEQSRKFDYVLIDCAPGLSAISEASIRLADLVIVPTMPDFLSTAGLQAFCNSFWKGSRLTKPISKTGAKPYVLITRKRATREHNVYTDKIRDERRRRDPSFLQFKTEIPESTAVAEALGKTGTGPTFTNKWGQQMVTLMKRLVKETKEELDGA